MKAIFLGLIVFTLLVYDVQSAVNSKSVFACLLAFAFENFYLNLNIGLYLVLWVMFAVNKRAISEEHIEEKQIWQITYEFFWINKNSNIYKRTWKLWVITLAAKTKELILTLI